MICWINGSFGAGKTVLAGELLELSPGSVLYDPEEVGFMLRDMVPRAVGRLPGSARVAAAGGGDGPGAG